MRRKHSMSIAETMVKHHVKIDKLLHEFKNGIKQKDVPMIGAFNKFKWELEKHFFLEEKAIFQLHYSENEESNEIKNKLKKEHDSLRGKLDEIEEDLKNQDKIDIFEFRRLLLEHKDFENRIFYPRLDKELDEDRKKLILDRLNNPI